MSDLFLSELNELTDPTSTDIMHVRRNSDSSDPDKRMLLDKLVLMSGAQTIAGAKTFSGLLTASAGIQFGSTPKSTLNRYVQQQTWTPVITGSVSNPTTGSGTYQGEYTWDGNVLHYKIVLSYQSVSGGSGDVRVSLPQPVSSGVPGPCFVQGVNFGASEVTGVFFSPTGGQSYGLIQVAINNAGAQTMQCSQLANFQILSLGGWYFAN